MTKTPFAKSSSKTALMERLGLYGPEGEQIYVLLYNESSNGRDRLSYHWDSLSKQSKKEGVQAPYKWDNLEETARHREILNIVRNASVYTRPYYQKGRWQSAVEENWVTEWFLWHSFRFRDNRNHQLAVQEHHAVQQPTGGRATGGASGAGRGGESPYEEPVWNKV